MSAAPLNTEAARRTHQRRSHPILLNLTHTTRLSLCLIHIAWHGRSRLEASVLAQVGRIYSHILIYRSL